jgi:hypothetical protein
MLLSCGSGGSVMPNVSRLLKVGGKYCERYSKGLSRMKHLFALNW